MMNSVDSIIKNLKEELNCDKLYGCYKRCDQFKKGSSIKCLVTDTDINSSEFTCEVDCEPKLLEIRKDTMDTLGDFNGIFESLEFEESVDFIEFCREKYVDVENKVITKEEVIDMVSNISNNLVGELNDDKKINEIAVAYVKVIAILMKE